MSNPSNQVMDTDSLPIDQFMARMIRTFGRCMSLKRIYLAGIHLEMQYKACPEIRPQKADPFFIRVGPKMVLCVKKRPSLHINLRKLTTNPRKGSTTARLMTCARFCFRSGLASPLSSASSAAGTD